MTREEFVKTILMLESQYQNMKVSSNDLAMETWYKLIGHIEFRSIQSVILKHMAESSFQPMPHDILKQYAETTMLPQKDPAEAWGEVTNAIRRFGYYRESDALASMSPETAQVVKAMSWRELCMSENQMADRAHFIKMYATTSERNTKNNLLPPALRNEIKQLTDRLSMPQISAPNE